jgi:CHAD domain-containing protein
MKTFHKCRKKIKNMLYFYNTLPKKMARKLHLNTLYLDQLQDAIGQYHDADLFQALRTAPKRQIVQSNRKYHKMYALIRQFRKEYAIY